MIIKEIDQADRLLLRNICWLTWLAIAESLQLTILVIVVSQFILIKTPTFIQHLFPANLNDVRPERGILFYQIFVAVALLIAAVLIGIRYQRLRIDQISPSLKSFVLVVTSGLVSQLFAAFKWITSPALAWPKILFYFALVATIGCQIFLPELKAALSKAVQLWKASSFVQKQVIKLGMEIVFLLGLGFALFGLDMNKVLARDFAVDQFYHFDGFIMSSTWAWLQGCVPNVDVISQYSLLLPVIIGSIAKWMGGLSYLHVDEILMAMTGIYLLLAYTFMRSWLKNRLIAVFGILLFVKWNFFHWGVTPIIWMLPGVIPVRYIFDVAVLWLIFKDLKTPALLYRGSAALLCGLAMAYMVDTGLYLTAAFGAYVGLNIFLYWSSKDRLRRLIEAAVLLILAIGIWWIVWYSLVGPWIFIKTFWSNVTEHIALFLNGWGALPIYDGLKERNFFAFVMGLVIPIVYVATAMVTASMVFLKKAHQKWLLTTVMALYGLLIYHYFIIRSAVSSYYVVCLPFVFILCFWINEFIPTLKGKLRLRIQVALVGWAVVALFSNQLFVYYPNIFNLAGYDWKPEIQFYRQEFQFQKDAALIQKFSKPGEAAPLISSFETQILIDANRKPFFYYFPLITSRFMSAQLIGGTYVHTRARMIKTLNQLETAKPAYVFVEKRLFNHTLPERFYQYFQTVSLLMDYLHNQYTSYEEGQYLVALKRR